MTEETEWELLGRIPRDAKNEWKVDQRCLLEIRCS